MRCRAPHLQRASRRKHESMALLEKMELEQFVRSFDGTELYTSSVGIGAPALVLCDGLGCDGFIWRYLLPYYGKLHQVVHWHNRGHGLSRPPADPANLDVPSLTKDLLAVLDAYELSRAVLMGHSMGVQVLLQFALDHPERVAGLVPICGSYGRPLDTFHDNPVAGMIFPWLRRLMSLSPRRSQRVWQNLVASRLTYRLALTTEVNGRLIMREELDPYFDHLAYMDHRVFIDLLAKLTHHTVEHALAEIQTPTLVVAGERDTFTPMWLSKRMQQLMPNAELLVVPGGSHVAPLEVPELVELRTERFFSEKIRPEFKVKRRTSTRRRSATTRRKRAEA